MTIQITSLLIGCLIPLLWSGAVLPYRQRQLGRVDYEHPRLKPASSQAEEPLLGVLS